MTRAEEVRLLWSGARDDTAYRTVASRAYYACFTRCMILAQRRGFVPVGTGEDHRGLSDYFKDTTRHAGLETRNLLHRIGATRLVKLRRLRNAADYQPGNEFTRGDAREAVDVFEDIEALLDKVEAEIAEVAR